MGRGLWHNTPHYMEVVKMKKRSSQLDHDEYEHLINHYLIRDDWHAAYQCSLEANNEFTDDGEFQYQHGSICAYLKKFEDAIKWLSMSLETGLDSFYPASFQLGLIYLTSGRMEEAKSAWSALYELDNNHYFGLFRDGMLGLVENNFELALNKIESGIKVNSDFPSINNDMEIVLTQINGALDSNKHVEKHYDSVKAEIKNG